MTRAKKEPRYAPGHELTLHPGDPVRGAELLEAGTEAEPEATPEAASPEHEGRKELRF